MNSQINIHAKHTGSRLVGQAKINTKSCENKESEPDQNTSNLLETKHTAKLRLARPTSLDPAKGVWLMPALKQLSLRMRIEYGAGKGVSRAAKITGTSKTPTVDSPQSVKKALERSRWVSMREVLFSYLPLTGLFHVGADEKCL